MNFKDHHAYLIEGERNAIVAQIHLHLENILGNSLQGNPDVLEHTFLNLTIDDARTLKTLDAVRPFQGERKFIIVSFDSINREAQHALLKVFEEPSESSRFFLVTRSASSLLPTLLSRVEVMRHSSFNNYENILDYKKFLTSNPSRRLEFIADIMKKVSNETLSKQNVRDFLRCVTREFEESVLVGKREVSDLQSVLRATSYMEDTSASLKLLLERIALC
jgi:hypothetical protein